MITVEECAQIPPGSAKFLTEFWNVNDRVKIPSELGSDEALSNSILGTGTRIVAGFDATSQLQGLLIAELGEDEIRGMYLRIRLGKWAVRSFTTGLIPALYSHVAESAVRLEALLHSVECSSEPKMLTPWIELGFGIEQAYAQAKVESLETQAGPVLGITLRRVKTGDESLLDMLSQLIVEQQHKSPVFAFAPQKYRSEIREGFRNLPQENALIFIALRGDSPVGYQCWFDDGDGCAELSVSAVVQEERGKGIGTALTAACAQEARARGWTKVRADWRTANLFSSAFWPARGFEIDSYRLSRRIDPRYATT